MTVEMFEPEFEKIAAQRQSESIFPLRDNEPEYAKLNDETSEEKNRYGNLISLTNLAEEAASLNINGVSEKGFNPNRNKQHAFHSELSQLRSDAKKSAVEADAVIDNHART